jgi:heat shock protein HslJ
MAVVLSLRRFSWLGLVGLGIMLAACAAPPAGDEPGAGLGALEGTEWTLVSLAGREPLAGTQITLEFAEGSAGGYSGCNQYGGSYPRGAAGELRLTEIASTAMLCQDPAGVMEQEAAFLQALQSVTAYRLEGERLELLDEAGKARLAFEARPQFTVNPAELLGTGWQLRSQNGQALVAGSAITLFFEEDGRMRGSAGCRNYTGTYLAEGDDLHFPQIAMEELGCLGPEALRRQEADFTDALSLAGDYRLEGRELEIFTAPGGGLLFDRLEPGAEIDRPGTTWVLQSFQEAGAVTASLPGSRVTLLLKGNALRPEGSLGGSAGCNTYSAAYAFDGSSLQFSAPAATKKACAGPPGIMKQEQKFLEWLAETTICRIEGDNLFLETADGRVLNFAVDE